MLVIKLRSLIVQNIFKYFFFHHWFQNNSKVSVFILSVQLVSYFLIQLSFNICTAVENNLCSYGFDNVIIAHTFKLPTLLLESKKGLRSGKRVLQYDNRVNRGREREIKTLVTVVSLIGACRKSLTNIPANRRFNIKAFVTVVLNPLIV